MRGGPVAPDLPVKPPRTWLPFPRPVVIPAGAGIQASVEDARGRPPFAMGRPPPQPRERSTPGPRLGLNFNHDSRRGQTRAPVLGA